MLWLLSLLYDRKRKFVRIVSRFHFFLFQYKKALLLRPPSDVGGIIKRGFQIR